MYLTRNQAYRKVPWVRIPPSPPVRAHFSLQFPTGIEKKVMKSGLYALFFLPFTGSIFLLFTQFWVGAAYTCRYVCRYAARPLCAIPTNWLCLPLSAAPDVSLGFDGYGILHPKNAAKHPLIGRGHLSPNVIPFVG